MPNFPLPISAEPDPRWSWDLLQDLGEVFVQHGFPDPMANQSDGTLLQHVVFLFLFGSEAGGGS